VRRATRLNMVCRVVSGLDRTTETTKNDFMNGRSVMCHIDDPTQKASVASPAGAFVFTGFGKRQRAMPE